MAADFGWWRELIDAQQVSLCIKAQELSGVPRVVADDPAYRDQVFSRLRPDAQWLPEWFEAHLIEVQLAPEAAERACR